MKKTLRLCLLAIALFGIVPCTGQSLDTLLINASFKQAYCGNNCYVRAGEDFMQLDPADTSWTKVTGNAKWLSPGQTHWMAMSVNNADTFDHTMKLYFNNVQAGHIRIYIETEGKIDSGLITGSLVPIAKRASPDRLQSVPFTIPGSSSLVVYAKIFRKGLGITITPELYRLPEKPAEWPEYVLVIVLTVIFLIMIATAFVGWFQRSKQIGWFFLYILFGFFYTMAASGFGSLFFYGPGFRSLRRMPLFF